MRRVASLDATRAQSVLHATPPPPARGLRFACASSTVERSSPPEARAVWQVPGVPAHDGARTFV